MNRKRDFTLTPTERYEVIYCKFYEMNETKKVKV